MIALYADISMDAIVRFYFYIADLNNPDDLNHPDEGSDLLIASSMCNTMEAGKGYKFKYILRR